MIEVISPLILLSIGIALIASEALVVSFVVFWFGLACLIVAGLTQLNIIDDIQWQLSIIALIAIFLLFTLRTKALKYFLKTDVPENEDNFLDTSGEGVIKENLVYFMATYWKIGNSQKETFEDGETVFVSGTKNGVAFIEKLKS